MMASTLDYNMLYRGLEWSGVSQVPPPTLTFFHGFQSSSVSVILVNGFIHDSGPYKDLHQWRRPSR